MAKKTKVNTECPNGEDPRVWAKFIESPDFWLRPRGISVRTSFAMFKHEAGAPGEPTGMTTRQVMLSVLLKHGPLTRQEFLGHVQQFAPTGAIGLSCGEGTFAGKLKSKKDFKRLQDGRWSLSDPGAAAVELVQIA